MRPDIYICLCLPACSCVLWFDESSFSSDVESASLTSASLFSNLLLAFVSTPAEDVFFTESVVFKLSFCDISLTSLQAPIALSVDSSKFISLLTSFFTVVLDLLFFCGVLRSSSVSDSLNSRSSKSSSSSSSLSSSLSAEVVHASDAAIAARS